MCLRSNSENIKPRGDSMKNTIGILGTGRMAVRLAKLFAACGHEVILGSRTPERGPHCERTRSRVHQPRLLCGSSGGAPWAAFNVSSRWDVRDHRSAQGEV